MNALVFGLVLSVALMGIASSLVAKLLNRFKWIGWIGLAIIVYVAIDMIWNGSIDLWRLYGGYIAQTLRFDRSEMNCDWRWVPVFASTFFT